MVGENEAVKIKETNVNKTKITRVAKMLYAMVLVGGLESGEAAVIPFRNDLLIVGLPEVYVWRLVGTAGMVMILIFGTVVYYFVRNLNALRGVKSSR